MSNLHQTVSVPSDIMEIKRNLVPLIFWVIFQVFLILSFPLGFFNLSLLFIVALFVMFSIFEIKFTLYFFVFSVFIGYAFLRRPIDLRLVDLVGLLLVVAYVTRSLLLGQFSISKTPLDKSIFLFLLILGVSLVNSTDLLIGVLKYLRQIELFIAFYVIASIIRSQDIEKLLKFYAGVAVLHSLYNLYLFVSAGGSIRSFGIADIAFADSAVIALIVCYSLCIFQTNITGKLKYLFMFLIVLAALLATQTRGALLSSIIGLSFVTAIALAKSKFLKLSFIRKNVLQIGILLVLLVAYAFFNFSSTILERSSHRVYSLLLVPFRGPLETIEIRMLLWQTALRCFLENPLLGIGIGQFKIVHLIFPDIKFIPLFPYLKGLGVHNIVLSYLAETGLLGVLSLFYFTFSFLRVAWQKYKISIQIKDICISTALLGILFFIGISFFYTESWFYSINGFEFMFCLALAVAFKPSNVSNKMN